MGQTRLLKAYHRTATIITVHRATTERNDLNTRFSKASISETMSGVLLRAILTVRYSWFCKLKPVISREHPLFNKYMSVDWI